VDPLLIGLALVAIGTCLLMSQDWAWSPARSWLRCRA
jgi:glycerol uptake facilitator-like aquaporin